MDDVCCAFNLEQQDICFSEMELSALGYLPTANRFTGANLALKGRGLSGGSRGLNVVRRSRGCRLALPHSLQVFLLTAPFHFIISPLPLFDHKFVFNLKTFHSSSCLKNSRCEYFTVKFIARNIFCLNIAVTVGRLHNELVMDFINVLRWGSIALKFLKVGFMFLNYLNSLKIT